MQMTHMNWVKCSAVNTYSGQISLGLGEVLNIEVRQKLLTQNHQMPVVMLEVRAEFLMQD
jgi:hypothetical protein